MPDHLQRSICDMSVKLLCYKGTRLIIRNPDKQKQKTKTEFPKS